MLDPQYALRIWLKEKLEEKGHGAKGALARHLGVKPDAVTRMMNTDPEKETRVIRAHELLQIRVFFGEASEDEVVATPVPLMGYVGAGAEIQPEFEQVPPEGLEDVELPFPLPDEMIAFRVRGDSMLPVYKPDTVIIVYREQRRPLETFYGQEAAVRTDDGRRFIKTITSGRGGDVILTSWNADPIVDVTLVWIGEVFAVLPPTSVRQVTRKGGLQGTLNLPAGVQ